MAVLPLAVLILVMAVRSSATWCICKNGVSDSVLQKSLDYACGAGADCGPIHPNRACYQPNNVRAHCSFAVNSYFQRKGQAQSSCDFAGTATISPADPSTTGCVYPSSPSNAGSSTIPGTATSSTTTTTPYTTGTPTGVLGGVGPSGAGINTDGSDAGFRLEDTTFFAFFITLLFSSLMLWWD